jgi:hypothetical protein
VPRLYRNAGIVIIDFKTPATRKTTFPSKKCPFFSGTIFAECANGNLRSAFMYDCTRNIMNVMRLCSDMLICADRGDLQRKDESCGVLFGVVRDNAYKMLDLARKERNSHIAKGTWDSEVDEAVPGIDKETETKGTGN